MPQLVIDRQPEVVHIRDGGGRCIREIDAMLFAIVEAALREEFLAAAVRVAGMQQQPEGAAPWAR